LRCLKYASLGQLFVWPMRHCGVDPEPALRWTLMFPVQIGNE